MRASRLRTFVLVAALGVATPGCAVLIGAAAAGGVAGGVSSAQSSQKETHSAWTYVGTVLANVVYFPAKVVLAGAGAATSGLAFLVTAGSHDTADRIWNASVEGDYVVTPRMVEGREPVRFIGS